MADPVESATNVITGAIPKVQLLGGGFVNMFAWFIMLVITIIFFGIVLFFVIRGLRYNKRLEIYEKIGGKILRTKKDRATEVKFSTAGDTIFYCLKHKKYLPNPSLQSAPRTYYYYIREDGEWINFEIGDLDEISRKSGARFLEKEARFARTQIQKGLKERYDKPGFWQQYGLMIMNVIWIAMIGVMTFLLFDKWIDLAGATNAGVETAGRVLEKTEDILAKLDGVCSGSGIRTWLTFGRVG